MAVGPSALPMMPTDAGSEGAAGSSANALMGRQDAARAAASRKLRMRFFIADSFSSRIRQKAGKIRTNYVILGKFYLFIINARVPNVNPGRGNFK